MKRIIVTVIATLGLAVLAAPSASAGSSDTAASRTISAVPLCSQTPPDPDKYNIHLGTKYGGDACSRCIDQGYAAVQQRLISTFYCRLTGPVGPEYVVDWWGHV